MALREQTLEDGVLTLQLEAAERGNSWGREEAEALAAILTKHGLERGKPKISSVLLLAPGRLFCGGGNLTDYRKMRTAEQGRKVNRRIGKVLDSFAGVPVPTACVVSGDCFGGGVELISTFDHVISVPEAFFGLWQRRMALSFGWGGGSRLQDRIGPGPLKRLAMEARSFSAYEALELGLIDEIAPGAHAEARAREWLKAAARLPSEPLAGLKNYSPKSERKLFESLWWLPAHRELLGRRR